MCVMGSINNEARLQPVGRDHKEPTTPRSTRCCELVDLLFSKYLSVEPIQTKWGSPVQIWLFWGVTMQWICYSLQAACQKYKPLYRHIWLHKYFVSRTPLHIVFLFHKYKRGSQMYIQKEIKNVFFVPNRWHRISCSLHLCGRLDIRNVMCHLVSNIMKSYGILLFGIKDIFILQRIR